MNFNVNPKELVNGIQGASNTINLFKQMVPITMSISYICQRSNSIPIICTDRKQVVNINTLRTMIKIITCTKAQNRFIFFLHYFFLLYAL